MRAFVRVYRSCREFSDNQSLLLGSRKMETTNHRICSSSLAGETEAKKKREIPDASCPTVKINVKVCESPPYVSRMENKMMELERANGASEQTKNNGERRPSLEKDKPIIFFFDLETSGLEAGCDILQISLRSRESHFTFFVTPTKPIDEAASRINNLYYRDGNLYKGEQQVETLPLDDVLQKMLDHLSSFNKKCLLVAHYCPFDSRHLLAKLQQNSTLFGKFKKLLYGFADSYEMFAEKYPDRRWVKGTLTLRKLVEESLGMSTANAHDAGVDTLLLQKLVQHHFTDEEIFDFRVTLAYALENRRNWYRRKRTF